MRIDLLTILADKLDTIPPSKFNIAIWFETSWFGFKKCGCAIGWATQMSEFNAEGLTLSLYGTPRLCRNGETSYSSDACVELFEMTLAQASSLFCPSGYDCRNANAASGVTPSMIATKIRRMIQIEQMKQGELIKSRIVEQPDVKSVLKQLKSA